MLASITKLFLVALYVTAIVHQAQGADFSGVPGVVINHLEPPTPFQKLFNTGEHYTSDPSIVVLPNGDYIASHSEFDSGTTAATSGKTWIFKSTDQGETWTQSTILNNFLRGSLFVHNNDLYSFGFRAEASDVVIRKSVDNGSTWTSATNSSNGIIFTGNHGGTPNNPVVHEGKIWTAQDNHVMSASVNSDLLNASSWTRSNYIPSSEGEAIFGNEWLGWSEGQVVASPEEGVVILPKVRGLPYTALLRATPGGSLTFDRDNDFIPLPGGEKKFGASYDATSGKFYALTNLVLPTHANDQGLGNTPQLIRNTAAMLSSNDLRHWDVEKIFLYSQNIDNGSFGEGFQYFNFGFDGDDLAIVSRTAYDTRGNGTSNPPPRGHDSNLLTFHRIDDFRMASPDHRLVVDTVNNRVLRWEVNDNDDLAPLGKFSLGATFAGSALNSPIDLAQDANGDVYIKEQGGRILQFDATGNFLEVTLSAPVPFQGSQIAVTQPSQGERTWTASGSEDWHEPTNWYYWSGADTREEVGIFGSAADTDSTITLKESLTLKGLIFRNSHTYTIAGPGTLTINSDSGSGMIAVHEGSHQVQVKANIDGPTEITVAAGSTLTFGSDLSINNNTDFFGPGNLDARTVMNIGVDSPGILNLTGGNVTANSDANPVINSYLIIGNMAQGTVNHSAGTLQTAQGNIAVGGTAPGFYNLSGTGRLSTPDGLLLGRGSGSGGSIVTQTGGLVTASYVTVGRSGTGHYDVSDGSLTTSSGNLDIASSTLVGSSGSTFTQSGGNVTVAGNVRLGDEVRTTESGSYSISGGSLSFAGKLRVRNGSRMTIVGDSATIVDTLSAPGGLSQLDGTLEYQFDADGVSLIDLSIGSTITRRSDIYGVGTAIEIDGSNYSGGPGTFTLIEHGGYSANDAGWGSISITGFSLASQLIENANSIAIILGLPSDYNNDGFVDAADYTVWRDNIGAPAGTLPNDPSGLPISQAQYDTWVANFGSSFQSSTTSVPEPISVALTALGIVSIILGRVRIL